MYSIDNYNFSGKKVLVRVDFNVPLNENLEITDDTRIITAIPTIQKILAEGGAIILLTHLGRPKGMYNKKMSLQIILPYLKKVLDREVKFAPDCIGEETEKLASNLKPGEVLLLENLRFHNEETEADEEFAEKLARLGDAYINNAFGTAHRAHASTYTIAKHFPKDSMFGYLVENEIQNIDKILYQPIHPFTAILGGSKVSTKIHIIEALIEKVDNLIIAGGIGFTFAKAMGGNIGNSLVEDNFLDFARQIIREAEKNNVKLYLPTDCIVADEFKNDAHVKHCDIMDIPDGWMGLDIGIKSANKFAEVIENSQKILWNGPIGVFEMPSFSMGTLKVAMSVARATDKGAYSLTGGGDSIAAVNKYSLAHKISYISTAGGALLEYIEGKELPSIKAIKQNLTIDRYNFQGKKVLMRVDFNVPLNERKEITDATRIITALPTVRKILADGGSIIFLTHLGRPKGKYDENLSLKHILPFLNKSLDREINFAPDCLSDEAKTAAKELKPGECLLLENLRFYKEETEADENFARQLAEMGDAYVFNAFGTAHRAHASTYTIAKFFPNDKMLGYLVENEINNIDKVVKQARRPFTAIIGGSKVSTKIHIILALLEKVDNLIVGGGIVYTFIKALGGDTGNSLVERDHLETAQKIMAKAKENGVNLYLPTDCIIADDFKNDANIEHCEIDKIKDGWMGLDIGIKSANQFTQVIENSSTILWNGPIGVFEMSNFSMGTLKIAMAVARATDKGAFSLIGGGDSISAVNKYSLAYKISYISTAGGALLEYIEGKQLPALKAITEDL
ncbi:MAG TPA: phosphoglycerate kinase [Bacteroidales bacterium]|nr:phosphoglycerate kinase [Bacteroidales bacterium]